MTSKQVKENKHRSVLRLNNLNLQQEKNKDFEKNKTKKNNFKISSVLVGQ